MEQTLIINSPLLQKIKSDRIAAVFVKGTGWVLVVMVSGAGIGFLVQIILARLLGVAQYGQYAYVVSWLMILVLPCKLGMETTLVRFLPAYRTRKEWARLHGILQFAKKSTTMFSLSVACMAALVIWKIRSIIGDELATIFWFGCSIIPVLTMLHIRQSALRAFNHMILSRLPESVIQPLLLIFLAILTGLFTDIVLNSSLVMIFHGTTLVFVLLLSSKWLSKSISQIPASKVIEINSKEWLSVGLALLIMGGFSLAIQRTDIIMVGAYLGTTKAGIYNVVIRLANLLILGLTAANFVAAPMISELYVQGKKSELQQIVSRMAVGVCAITIPVAVGMVLFSSWLLKLFGDGFDSGYYPLLILIGGQLINALFGAVGYLLTMTGHQRQAVIAMGSTAGLNLIMNAILIPLMGIAGAALATTLSTIFWNVIMFRMVRCHLSLDPTMFSIFSKRP